VVFPKLYQEVKNLLKDGKVVMITGKADLREDDISFIVEKMVEVKHDDTHHILIPLGTPQERLVELKKILEDNAGNEGVTLNFEADPSKFELGKKIIAKQKVTWNEELEEKIRMIIKQ
jgi:DNA polymerase III alpha subunit